MRPQRVSCGIRSGPTGGAASGSFNEAAACQLRNPTEEALATCDNCSFNEAAACQLRNPREFGLVGRVAGVLQ